jgi:BirA family transcriptional regulator, biotin operon repressor / biotin---[acetyl-CoA-carboxylase] ligase
MIFTNLALFETQLNSKQPTIEELLASQWLKSVEWFDEIDSTNSAARRGAPFSSLTPALFVADRQTAGRGRSERPWWSPAGCLMMTLAIGSDLLPSNPADWGQLALVCGVAVAESVEQLELGVNCELKWPNDVYVGNRKLAGILIESAGTAPQVPWLIGIGLNVNADWTLAPEELAGKATSLSQECGREVDLGVVLVEVTKRLEYWITHWRQGEVHWHDGWRDRCLLTGKVIRIRVPAAAQTPVEIIGRCEGLDATGRLVLCTSTSIESFASAEVIGWD